MCLICHAQHKIKYSHYQYHVPDWLWNDPMYNVLIDSAAKKNIAFKVDSLRNMNGDKYPGEHWKRTKEVATIINGYFALTEAEKKAIIFHSGKIHLALKTDPYFDLQSQKTLQNAVRIFSEIALDDDVIAEALDSSIERPEPFPKMFTDSSKWIKGQPEYSSDYSNYFYCRTKPIDLQSFKTQLQQALSTEIGDPALLLISSYDSDVWWGFSHYNFYYHPFQQLSRLSPTHGFFSIAFNVDSLERRQDPVFWASKVGHECLHNLGYWHPNYKDPNERDMYNKNGEEAFIVAYERALLKKAKKIYR